MTHLPNSSRKERLLGLMVTEGLVHIIWLHGLGKSNMMEEVCGRGGSLMQCELGIGKERGQGQESH